MYTPCDGIYCAKICILEHVIESCTSSALRAVQGSSRINTCEISLVVCEFHTSCHLLSCVPGGGVIMSLSHVGSTGVSHRRYRAYHVTRNSTQSHNPEQMICPNNWCYPSGARLMESCLLDLTLFLVDMMAVAMWKEARGLVRSELHLKIPVMNTWNDL